MTLPEKAYDALKDIVGPEFITREPAVLDGYCFVWGNELIFGEKFSQRPPAVVMPQTVEEVQAIVRVCNRFKLKFRAHATGFETSSITSDEPFIPIDLRRMNRILEIDVKNRFAVVEPYVSQAKLFVETMKRGLRPNMLGAGPSASVMAGTAAHFGSGPTNISTDFGGRNLLGLEWVLPDGEILRLGSSGCGAGWFSGDGPGPSLRGVVRGYGGANGGNGVFTKAATKLYPWYGPSRLNVTGEAPVYEMEIPENFKDYCVVFPGRKELADFLHLIYEESIAFSLERLGPAAGYLLSTRSNDELWQLIKDFPAEQRREGVFSMMVTLDAFSSREMEYKKKCFDAILERTSGTVIPFDERISRVLFNSSVTAQGMTRATFRASGSFVISPVAEESIDATLTVGKRAYDEILKPVQDSGSIMATGSEPVWGVVYGGDGTFHAEVVSLYDPADKKSCESAAGIIGQGDEKIVEWGLGINSLENALSYKESALKAAHKYEPMNFIHYMKEIKKAFDPNFAAESSFYVSPEKYE